MYPMNEEQARDVVAYTKALGEMVVGLVGEAIEALGEARLSWETGRADFAVNRRENDQGAVPALKAKLAVKGPIDHDVPVLKVADPSGKIVAIVFAYACHCTTLDINQFNGDYAGYAMLALERAHPGATALFVAGCGADTNPLPRRSVELCERYGNELADAVGRVLAGAMRPLMGEIVARYREIPLAFGAIPPRAQWEADAKSDSVPVRNRARALLAVIDKEGALPTTYPYPIQVWEMGQGLTWVLMGGEVVVDYSLRIKRNLGSSRTWVSAYCNDVMAYIPSLRVLREGGYEGAGAMLYYGQPTAWSEKVEDQIIDGLAEMLEGRSP
jgi:hypothetical protein